MPESCKRPEIVLLTQAGLWVLAVRIGLWVFSFRRLRRVVDRLTETDANLADQRLVSQSAGAILFVSRYVPRATCLTQAVALHILLRRAGLESEVHIGVSKASGRFSSHAWVESGHKVVIGDCGLDRHKLIMVWN